MVVLGMILVIGEAGVIELEQLQNQWRTSSLVQICSGPPIVATAAGQGGLQPGGWRPRQ